MKKIIIAVLSSSYKLDELPDIYDPIFLGDVNELFGSKINFEAILIDYTGDQKIYDCISVIKKNQDLYLLPLYTTKNIDSHITDGQLSNDSYDKTKKIHTYINDLDTIKLDWQSRLLYFLYTRLNLKLKPSRDIKNPQFFSYDLINIFADSNEINIIEYLNRLCDDQILQKIKLLQTLFACQKCFSVHIYFSDHCPNCNSLEIEYCDFIHCFSCGNISPEKEFLYQNTLKCPNCHSVLRHISVDYDKPLENYQCNQCEHQFEEASIKSTCMNCENESGSEKLVKTYIYEYQLTEFGRKYIYENQEFALSIFDKINYVKPNVFYQQAQWLLRMQARDKCFMYSLMYFRVGLNVEYLRIQDIAEALKKMLRDTDILTRINNRIIWVILPSTSIEGSNIVVRRIRDQLSQHSNFDLEMFCLASESLNISQNIKDIILQHSGGLN